MFLKLPHCFAAATAACAVGVGVLALSSTAQAQYPDKTIRLVVPFAPGGGTDLIARPLAAEMSKELGQSVIVDNKAGAGTMIGTDNVARSPADGYSILVASFAHVVNPLIHQSVPYKDNTAFAPVMLVGLGPNVLVVPADSPYQSVEQLIAGAKAHPGKLAYASQGAGTSAHLAGELFAQEAGVEVTHVAYRGAAPALADVMGGVVNYMFATAASAKPYISNGKLRALAVTTAEESEAFPGVPSIHKQLPGVQVQSWYGLYVPAGTPAEVIARINAAANKASASELMQKGAKTEGVRIVAGTPEALAAFEQAETERWTQFLQKNKIQIN